VLSKYDASEGTVELENTKKYANGSTDYKRTKVKEMVTDIKQNNSGAAR
jgi:hypothetical protein